MLGDNTFSMFVRDIVARMLERRRKMETDDRIYDTYSRLIELLHDDKQRKSDVVGYCKEASQFALHDAQRLGKSEAQFGFIEQAMRIHAIYEAMLLYLAPYGDPKEHGNDSQG